MNKNPNRVAAGKRNRALRGELSEASRQRIREAAIRNRPWESSTGPRTEAGKVRSSRNRTRPKCPTYPDLLGNAHQISLCMEAKELMSRVASIRRELIVNGCTGEITRGQNVASKVHQLLVGASRETTQQTAIDLQGETTPNASQ